MPQGMPQRCRIIMTSIALLAANQSSEHSGNIFLGRTRHGQNLIVEYFRDFKNPESIKVYLQREKEFSDVFRVFGCDFREVHKAYRNWGDNMRKYVFSIGFKIPGTNEYVSEDC